MAKKITAYSCEHKCGRNVLTSKKSMEEHESKCFYNPVRKACVSCKYFEVDCDDNGMTGSYKQTWRHNLCNKQEICLDKLTYNCEFYKPIGEI